MDKRSVVFLPKTGLAGNMIAGALYDLCVKQIDGFEKEFQMVQEDLADLTKIIIEPRPDGVYFDTQLAQDKTYTYNQAKSILEDIMKRIRLDEKYKEHPRRTLDNLIEAEKSVHQHMEDYKIEKLTITPPKIPSNSESLLKETAQLTPIGIAHTPHQNSAPYQVQTKTKDTHGGEFQYFIELDKKLKEGLQDLTKFHYVYVISHLHKSTDKNPLIISPPWEDPPTPRGIFATRSPHRPNPIGISIARLLGIKNNRIFVENLDLFDGTPILDIKPYIQSVDVRLANDGWVKNQEHLHMHRAGIFHNHNTNSDSTAVKDEGGHLHEAADIIIDAVLPAYFLSKLKIPLENIYLQPPIALGKGKITFSHGTFELPAPAVRYMIEHYALPTQKGPYPFELTTPTGAALAIAFGFHHTTTQIDLNQNQDNIQAHNKGMGYGSKQKHGLNALTVIFLDTYF